MLTPFILPLVASLSLPQVQDVNGQPVFQPPPLQASRHLDDSVVEFDCVASTGQELSVEVTFNTLGRELTTRWEWGASSDSFWTSFAQESVTFPLTFWPTTACYLGDRKIAVAGKSGSNGDAVIEVWTFAQPAVFSVGDPAQHFLRVGMLSDRRVAFTASATSPVGLPRAIWRNRGVGLESIFVFGFEERDLHSLDLTSGLATLAATDGLPGGSLPSDPMLQQFWPAYTGPYRHSVHGDMYGLTLEGDISREGTLDVHTLYFCDGDKNGTIDSILQVTGTNEATLGLHDADAFED